MRWSERQLAMLREMGIRVWATPAREDAGDATVVAERRAEPASAPAATVAQGATPPRPGPVLAAEPSALAALPSADWLVVAERFDAAAADSTAAAEQELLLDNMLRAIRVTRHAAGREGRAGVLAVGEGGAAAVDAAIAAVQPRCILAFGRAAAATLLGVDAPLGKLREQVHERGGIPVVVTFALPYLLRHAADKPRAWMDLCRAVAAIG
jgi:hypothetical protein